MSSLFLVMELKLILMICNSLFITLDTGISLPDLKFTAEAPGAEFCFYGNSTISLRTLRRKNATLLRWNHP